MAAADAAAIAEHKRLFDEKVTKSLGEMKDDSARSQFLTDAKFAEIAECVGTWPQQPRTWPQQPTGWPQHPAPAHPTGCAA
eukprot:1147782-Prymnesium_polylepis.1